jgi:hypothetical protein
MDRRLHAQAREGIYGIENYCACRDNSSPSCKRLDPDAKTHTMIVGQAGTAGLDFLLDFDRAAHRLNRACKLCDDAVANTAEPCTNWFISPRFGNILIRTIPST